MNRLGFFPARNASLAAMDYLAQPILLLAVTPVLLRHLGQAGFSVYLLVNSIVAASTLLSSGFGDALIRHRLEFERSYGHRGVDLLTRTVATLNGLLGLLLGFCIVVAAPWIGGTIRGFSAAEVAMCAASLRIGSVLLAMRSVENAVLACLRSFERYEVAVPVSIGGKAIGMLIATAMALRGHGVESVIGATALTAALAVAVELKILRRQGIFARLRPLLDRRTLRHIGGFGALSWVQSIVGVVTQQADRLIVGAFLGAASFSTYSLCAQLAMPVHSITGAGLQALFPRLSHLSATDSPASFRSALRSAWMVNIGCVLVFGVPLLLFAEPVLRHWVGPEIARAGAMPLRWMTLGAMLLALNVTGYWALMAMGHIRLLVLLNAAGALVMIAGVLLLTPRWGIAGAAMARVFYGPITWAGYSVLRKARLAEHAIAPELLEAA